MKRLAVGSKFRIGGDWTGARNSCVFLRCYKRRLAALIIRVSILSRSSNSSLSSTYYFYTLNI